MMEMQVAQIPPRAARLRDAAAQGTPRHSPDNMGNDGGDGGGDGDEPTTRAPAPSPHSQGAQG